MRSLRVVANRVLWRWGLRDVLPGHYVHRIPITECGEPLEPIPAVPGRLLRDPRLRQPHLARRSVAGALHQAAELLPEDVQLLVVVDITLANAAGTELWMGTGVGEFTADTRAGAKVTDTVAWRRQLLTRCLTDVGFINYPAEWWHFSLGDRLWAATGATPLLVSVR